MMEQFEKVRKGLQTAVDSDWMWQKADYIAMICKDALALINAQQERIKELEAAQIPRLLTLEEAKKWGRKSSAHKNAIYVENINDPGFVWAYTGHFGVAADNTFDGYGTSWRCWTQRPTDEQRKAVAWE